MPLDISQFLADTKTIGCVCPECEKVCRVSELQLDATAPAETWLDTHARELTQVVKEEQQVNAKISEAQSEIKKQSAKAVDEYLAQNFSKTVKGFKTNYKDIVSVANKDLAEYVVFRGLSEDIIESIEIINPGALAKKALKDGNCRYVTMVCNGENGKIDVV